MNIIYKNTKVNLPDFLVVGAAKSATTSLYFHLKKNPKIFLPEVKETSFFAFKNLSKNFISPPVLPTIKDENEYFKLYNDTSEKQLLGEISPAYLYNYIETVKNIKEYYGDSFNKIKIVMILRNPVDRLYSQYMMFKRDNLEPLNLYDATSNSVIASRMNEDWNVFYDYIGFSKYYEQVKYYLDNFPNVKILLFEDVSKDTAHEVKMISEFIGVEHYAVNTKTKFNKSGVPKSKTLHNLMLRPTLISKTLKFIFPKKIRLKIRHLILSRNLKSPVMSNSEYNRLLTYFEKDLKKLSNLIDVNIDHWRIKK